MNKELYDKSLVLHFGVAHEQKASSQPWFWLSQLISVFAFKKLHTLYLDQKQL